MAVPRNDGFTLLEVLVAVVIMAVIMTTAFGALRLGGRSWEAGVTRASDNERFRAVADLLRRQVHQVIPMSWPEDKKSVSPLRVRPTACALLHRLPNNTGRQDCSSTACSRDNRGPIPI